MVGEPNSPRTGMGGSPAAVPQPRPAARRPPLHAQHPASAKRRLEFDAPAAAVRIDLLQTSVQHLHQRVDMLEKMVGMQQQTQEILLRLLDAQQRTTPAPPAPASTAQGQAVNDAKLHPANAVVMPFRALSMLPPLTRMTSSTCSEPDDPEWHEDLDDALPCDTAGIRCDFTEPGIPRSSARIPQCDGVDVQRRAGSRSAAV